MQQFQINWNDPFEMIYEMMLYHRIKLTLKGRKNKVKLTYFLSILLEECEI